MSRKVGIAALIWGGSLLLSRVIGIIREGVIGRILGGGADADVYLAAFRIPDFLNYLLAGGALSIIFIPIFAGHLARDDEDKGWEAYSVIANTVLLLLAVALPLAWLATPWVVDNWLASGFAAEDRAHLSRLTRIVLPAQVFHLVGGLLSAALQARDRHTLPALAPLLYTGSIIAGGLIGQGPDGFVWGAVVGSILGPFGLPLIGNLRAGMRWQLILRFDHPDLRDWFFRSLPVMLAFSIIIWDDWVLTAEGSQVGEGAVATLTYAKTLMKVPMGVFGFATGVAAFPTLSRMVGRGEKDAAYTVLASACKRMLVLAFGAQVVLTAAGAEVAEVIYGTKLMDGQHADIGIALGLFGLGLWAWSAQSVLNRGFYALGQTWPPSLLGTVVFVAMLPVYHALRVHFGLFGLPVATTLALSFYTIGLVVMLRRRFVGVPDGFGAFLARMVVPVALGIASGLAIARWGGLPGALLRGTVAGGVGGIVYAASALIFGVPEVREVGAMVKRRLARGRS